MFARNHEVLRELLLEAKKHYLNASENMISIYVSTSSVAYAFIRELHTNVYAAITGSSCARSISAP